MKFLRRIREKFKRKREKPLLKKRQPVRFNPERRMFFKVTGTLILAHAISACISAPLPKESQMHLTSKPSSVKEVLEKTKGILNREKVFIKLKGMPGRIFALEGFETANSVSVGIPKEARSVIHTHPPTLNLPEKERIVSQKVQEIPSGRDIGKTIDDTPINHIPCISETGEVVGYLSMGLRKKSKRDIQTLEKTLSRIKEIGINIEREWTDGNFKELEESILEFHQKLKLMKTMGLLYHVKAMPGYEFKDNYFQKKN